MKINKFLGFGVAAAILMTACSNASLSTLDSNSSKEDGANVNVNLEKVENTDISPISGLITGSEEEENIEISDAYDSQGSLVLPFDQTFPEYMSQAKYDANSLLVKAREDQIYTVYSTLNKYGVASYERIVKVDQRISWYKLFLQDVRSNNVINLYRSLFTKDIVFDLNYVLDDSSLFAESDTDINSVSSDPTIDNCGIDGANGNANFKDQWHFKHLGLKETYKILKEEGVPEGGSSTVVAVIDTGVDLHHEDLKHNIWTNSLEIPDNGIDDDSNGYADDFNGWNFVDNDNNPDDDQGHGTHVAGIIAAENNKVGVVGVAYNTKIMPIKAGDGSGYFTQDRIASSIVYAYMNGADVINMSFGGPTCSLVVQDALEAAYTTSVLVAAAGNDGLVNEPTPGFAEYLPTYPAGLTYVLGVMSVAETNKMYIESSFSNIDGIELSRTEYEVYAPGESIYSTIPNNRYASLSGTSMAAPIVSGIVALLKSKFSDTNTYTTKFFMGQISGSSEEYPRCIHTLHNIPSIVNSYKALTTTPKPKLGISSYYIYDGKDVCPENNGDSTLDAGETVYVAFSLFNKWGKAKNVSLSIDTKSSISGEESKYVELENFNINYGDIGTYSVKEFIEIDEYNSNDVKINLDKCLIIHVSNDAPNNVVLSLNYHFNYQNGMDDSDSTIYSVSSDYPIQLKINRGISLPKMIKEDFTLTNDKLWIIDGVVQVGPEATLKIESGTEIIFGDAAKANLFGKQENSPNIVVYGRLIAEGKAGAMITIKHSTELYNDLISIERDENNSEGYVELNYCNITGQTRLETNKINHCNITVEYDGETLWLQSGNANHFNNFVSAEEIDSCKIKQIAIKNDFFVAFNIVSPIIKNSVFIFENTLSDWKMEASIDVNQMINSTFIPIGNVKISFFFPQPNCPVYLGWETEGRPSDTSYNKLYLSYDVNDKKEVWDIYQFIKETGKKLEEEHSITLFCNPFKHYTDECTCSFKNNNGFSFVFSKDNVYFFDGTIIPLEEFKELTNSANFLELNEGEYSLAHGEYHYSNREFMPYGMDYWNSTLVIDLLHGFGVENYSTGYINFFTEEEMQLTTKAGQFFMSECVKFGYGYGGGYGSSNINVLSSDLGNNVGIYAPTNTYLEGYSFDNLFNLNTNNSELIDFVINDGNDAFFQPYIGTTDENHEDNSELWPYVTNLTLTNSSGNKTNVFSNEILNVEIKFNREMDILTPLRVRFGSYAIGAEHEVEGDFVDSKTWVGTYMVTSIIESGTQYFNISGGAALTDGFMDVQEPVGRFQFVIDSTSALSKTISGVAQDDGILLNWYQDDYGLDTIMGYNIYRSNEENGNYTKINSTIIAKNETEFLDTGVEPGEGYWYTFTIVLTDFAESSPAGKIYVQAKDTMKPNIYHSPINEAYTGSKLTISCMISDNIGVENAYLCYRAVGEDSYKRILMNSSNNRYTASIPSTDISLVGLEYYIEASDGTNIVTKGSAENPYTIIIKDGQVLNSLGDVDGDGNITVKDAYLILQHIYGETILTGEQFIRADLNEDGVLSTSEAYRILQYINGNIKTLAF